MAEDLSHPDFAEPSPGADPRDATDRFLRLYSTHQRQIHAFIGTFLPAASDIEEVLQETSVVLWRKFEDLRPGSEFLPWACGVARLEVLRYLRQKRRAGLPLDESLIEVLASERQASLEVLENRRRALEQCLGRLKPVDRKLIERVYSPGATAKVVAEQMGRPVNAVYKSLGRIRTALSECVKRRLAADEVGA